MEKWKKRWALAAFLLVLGIILYLTLQGPEDTWNLTMKTAKVLRRIGMDVRPQALRHDAHYVEYFFLGMTIAILFAVLNKRIRFSALTGCVIAWMEEGLKVWLPTREFDVTDLARDMGAVLFSCLCVSGFLRIKKHVRRRRCIRCDDGPAEWKP